MMNREQLIAVFMNRAERAADEVLRLREALRLAGNTNLEAREMPKLCLRSGRRWTAFKGRCDVSLSYGFYENDTECLHRRITSV